MQNYKVIGLKNGKKFISGKSFEVVAGILTAKTEDEVATVNGSTAFIQGNIVAIAESELSMDAASILLQEKLKEISFFLTIDELQRLKSLPEPNRSEAIKVLKGNFFDVLDHYESTGVVNEDEDTPLVITDAQDGEDILPGETDEIESLKGDFPPADVGKGNFPPVDVKNGDNLPKEKFVSKFNEVSTAKELKAYLHQNGVTFDKTAKKEDLLSVVHETEKRLK